jgi:hypothetical protein
MHLTAAHISRRTRCRGPYPHCSTVAELRCCYLSYCGRPCRTERDLPFYEVRRGPVVERGVIQCQCLMGNA